METLGDVFTRDRRSEAPALVDATGREYDYHWLCTTAWKAGNFLRHTGVRRGVSVGVVGEGPLALLAWFGTALLEGRTRFDPPADCNAVDDLRTLVAPTAVLDDYDLPRGAQRVGYGGKPESPGVHHFDAGLWSENPSFPPITFGTDTPLLSGPDGRTYDHGEVIDAARSVAGGAGIDADTRVVVRGRLSDPRVATAGVIAPLVVGGTVVLAEGRPETGSDGSQERTETEAAIGDADGAALGDVAVTDSDDPVEATVIRPGAVELP